MTKRFNVYFTCSHCGKQTTAETAFGRWMRAHPDLKSENGIVRSDTDHTILRYKTHEQGRQFQLMIDLEVKEFGANPDPAQRDISVMKHQLIMRKGRNVNGSNTVTTQKLKSVRNGMTVNVRYMGYHLLQFEKTNPEDSDWIKWDHRLISKLQLIGLLNLTLNPCDPDRQMNELLRDRHLQRKDDLLI